jgi:UDP-3-O-[3-hydroxymyristoyl] glucosamine N-acyltransferase
MKLSEIAKKLDCALDGNGEIEIAGVNTLDKAGPSELTFLSNRKYSPLVKTTKAGAILLAKDAGHAPLPSLRCADPYLAFAKALELFYQPPRPAPGVHPTAVIAPGSKIGPNASIGPYAVVGEDVVIGANAVLHPHVVIYRGARIGDDFYAHSHVVVREFCHIGNRVTLQNGVIVGADGFGFAKQPDGSHYKMPQSGIAVIEDDVEMQALSAVDRATVGETRIKRGAKLDSFVQVGHAAVVGEDNIICAQVGIAGSSHLGKNVLLAGQVGVAGHMTVGDDVVITAQSGIHGDIPAGVMLSGTPAFDNRQWLRCIAIYSKLPELARTVRQLKAIMETRDAKDEE